MRVPLGKLVVVTGVSGSGKSTLVEDTLVPAIKHQLYRSRLKPAGYTELSGAQAIDKIINIDQSAIGRTPCSNVHPLHLQRLRRHPQDVSLKRARPRNGATTRGASASM